MHPPPHGNGLAGAGMPARILIAGNQQRYLKRGAEILESEGCKVSTASDAAQAVAQILAERPDLILMGAALRGMDGMTLAMHLKAEPATRDIRIVAWTASTGKRGAEKAAAAGCDGYIFKSMEAASRLADEIAPFLYRLGPAREPGAPQRQGLKILVVDDSTLNRELLAALLRSEGHVVLEAADGAPALSILAGEKIDAVISDVLMPSMDGYQLCHRIRGDERFKDLPVIIYSGTLTSSASQTLASELGAVRFLRKPFPLDAMIDALDEVISEAEQRREASRLTEAVPAGAAGNERLIGQLEAQNRELREATEQLLQTHHKLLVLARRLEDREEKLRKRNAQLEADLCMARETHLALMPRSYPSLPLGAPPGQSALRFHQRFAPKGTVSGDFFDVTALSGTRAGVFICDVMGHDVRAALVTAVIRGMLGELARAVSHPGDVLAEMNRRLLPILRQAGAPMFASAFYMTADAASGDIQYANAGHPSPFLVRRKAGAIERLGVAGHARGPALGFLEESRYPTGRRMLAPHDLVMLFTDGIFEVDGPDEEPFGQERLLEAVRSRIGLPPEQLFEELLDEVHRFSSTDDFEDDVCLLGMEVDHLC